MSSQGYWAHPSAIVDEGAKNLSDGQSVRIANQ